MRSPARRSLNDERGQGMVEFALSALVLVMLIAAVVELGRMVLIFTTVANAAKAGARYAIVHGADRTGSGSTGASGPSCPCSEVNTVVQNFASGGLLDTSRLTVNVTYPEGTNSVGSTVVVQASYLYDPLIPYFDPLLGTTLSSTSEGVISF